MTKLHLRKLDPANPQDLLDWQRVFRGAQSFTFATQGRPPTDADAQRMMQTLPAGRSKDDVHLFAIDVNGTLCGIAFLLRGYPAAEVTYLVALVLMEAFQNRSLGAACLERIEGLARSWQASKVSAVVDSANTRALAFWLRHGFREVGRRELPDLVGQAICIDKPLDARPRIASPPTTGVRVAVGILVIRDGLILLGKRKGSHGAGTWSAPGGRMEFGETIQECARRELREETGLEMNAVSFGPCTNDIFHQERQHYVTFLLIARNTAGMPANLEPHKCEGWSWHAWNQLPEPLFLPMQNLRHLGFSTA